MKRVTDVSPQSASDVPSECHVRMHYKLCCGSTVFETADN